MKNGIIEQFNNFTYSSPEIFFASFEGKFDGLSKIIWKEYLNWRNNGGKMKDFNFREIDNDIFVWKIDNEYFARKIEKNKFFSKEQYKKGLIAVYSFMEDRPQYYKFRKMEGMFNPLKLLLYNFF